VLGFRLLGGSGGDGVGVAVGVGPQVATVAESSVVPAGEGLDPVMSPAQRRQVLGSGLAGWAAAVGWPVGVEVVQVAAPCVVSAVGEHAVSVALDDQFPHPLRRVVGIDSVGAAQVQHRADPQVGAAEPVGQQVQGGRAEPLDRPDPDPGATGLSGL
jgi:hypothetical protein